MQSTSKTVLSFLFVCILGVLLHFTYDWSNQNSVVGFFSAKNESVWEHLKLLFFPMLFLTVIQFVKSPAEMQSRLRARTVGTLSGMCFIVVFFYLIWGISGRLLGFVNIALFFIGVFVAFRTEKKASKDISSSNASYYPVVWIVFTLLFVLFSIHAPNLGLFYDLITHPKSI